MMPSIEGLVDHLRQDDRAGGRGRAAGARNRAGSRRRASKSVWHRAATTWRGIGSASVTSRAALRKVSTTGGRLVDIADPNEPERGKKPGEPRNLCRQRKIRRPELRNGWRRCWKRSTTSYRSRFGKRQTAAPQSNLGYLPETGVLTELQDASKKQEFGRTVLLVMKALGPNGAKMRT